MSNFKIVTNAACLLMLYSTTVSEPQAMLRRMSEWIVNNKLVGMWKEAVVLQLMVVSSFVWAYRVNTRNI